MNMQAAHTNSLGTSAVQRLRLTLAMAEHVERIGARIRAKREELGLSRRKLAAEMAGVVTENDIYRWERGQHKPGDDKLEALALALKVDVSYFMLPDPMPGTPDLMESLNGDQSQLDRIESRLEDLQNKVGRLLLALEADGLSGALGRVADDLGAVVGDDAGSRSRAGKTERSGDPAGSRTPARAPKKRRA